MNRRTVLKGGLIAAVTAHTALAPAMAATTLETLAAHYSVLEELYEAAVLRSTAIDQSDKKPMWPQVNARELGRIRTAYVAEDANFYQEAEIAELFDRDHRYVLAQASFQPKEMVARAETELLSRKEAVLNLLRSRKAEYLRWEAESGYRESCKECGRIGKLLNATENKIIAYAPENLDDVRMKARFFDRVYGHAPPEDLVQSLLKSLVA